MTEVEWMLLTMVEYMVVSSALEEAEETKIISQKRSPQNLFLKSFIEKIDFFQISKQ